MENRGGYLCKRHIKELRRVAAVVIDDWLVEQMLGDGAFGGRGLEWW